MKIITLVVIASLSLAGCSKKADLVGTWNANLDGNNTITLNADHSAAATIDVQSLFGRVRGTSTGTWTILEKNRLLLEFVTRGVKTTEVDKFEIHGNDLILTKEDTGTTHRYTRVGGATSKADVKENQMSDEKINALLNS